MRKLLVLLVALLAVSAAPVSAAPEGFRDSSRLTPRIRAISGNPAAVVYCATSAAAFNAKARQVFSTSDVRGDAFTVYADNASYFQAHICGALERWIRGKPATRYEVGVASLTLAHEAGHLSGVVEEKAAECGAFSKLDAILRVHFAVENRVARRAMLAAARLSNSRKPAAYRC